MAARAAVQRRCFILHWRLPLNTAKIELEK
ncbi:uncharacterized protein PITG_19595 [Phytophthora infestans T30-4]|uniref:Uncharacterized protein n=1 Tax=Phytophthora infestans (strain T30-4) TaxID=403677 RepID=D0P0V4_PHYIT|nr:uncharacterized protein PITG_19595 [Phytophthora infestans T30-4]EEY53076.1 hypothetical protein PITG_19595 [Phytophthora infestans T30-4]|eukprot:XP_002896070.1 hypothetical protein PITG_19595 [Phytophthora infestans T30-4]